MAFSSNQVFFNNSIKEHHQNESLCLRKRKCPFGGSVGKKRALSYIAMSSKNGKQQNTTEGVLIQDKQGLLVEKSAPRQCCLKPSHILYNDELEETGFDKS